MKNKLPVLLLGGTGFVGKNILEQLSSKYRLIAPTHKELDLLNEADVRAFFSKTKPDIIIYAVNLGGTRKKRDSSLLFSQNLRMFFNVVRCNNYFKKMIFLGSGAEYDKRNPLVKIKETDFDKNVPADEYGYYKYICSKFIEQSDNIINLRIFGLFGKYEDYQIRFISNAIAKSINNLPITITRNVRFDYTSIDDFVQIIDYFITHKPKYKFYNIGSVQSMNLVSLAEYINSIAKKNQKIIIKEKGHGNEYTSDNSRLRKEIPTFTFTPLVKSINELYRWYATHQKLMNK